ncbi:hypothetical protein M885DRAFT_509456 [Pelagophyceae sp. CCMP2097]|nr:hypothetical protein M885DRAFT_509456 [Pelagophyceae sp. CCMP2097]
MQCLQTAHFCNSRNDETVFDRDVTVTRFAVIPHNVRPHPDIRPNFVSSTQQRPFDLEVLYSVDGESAQRPLAQIRGAGGATYSLRDGVRLRRLALRGDYDHVSVVVYGYGRPPPEAPRPQGDFAQQGFQSATPGFQTPGFQSDFAPRGAHGSPDGHQPLAPAPPRAPPPPPPPPPPLKTPSVPLPPPAAAAPAAAPQPTGAPIKDREWHEPPLWSPPDALFYESDDDEDDDADGGGDDDAAAYVSARAPRLGGAELAARVRDVLCNTVDAAERMAELRSAMAACGGDDAGTDAAADDSDRLARAIAANVSRALADARAGPHASWRLTGEGLRAAFELACRGGVVALFAPTGPGGRASDDGESFAASVAAVLVDPRSSPRCVEGAASVLEKAADAGVLPRVCYAGLLQRLMMDRPALSALFISTARRTLRRAALADAMARLRTDAANAAANTDADQRWPLLAAAAMSADAVGALLDRAALAAAAMQHAQFAQQARDCNAAKAPKDEPGDDAAVDGMDVDGARNGDASPANGAADDESRIELRRVVDFPLAAFLLRSGFVAALGACAAALALDCAQQGGASVEAAPLWAALLRLTLAALAAPGGQIIFALRSRDAAALAALLRRDDFERPARHGVPAHALVAEADEGDVFGARGGLAPTQLADHVSLAARAAKCALQVVGEASASLEDALVSAKRLCDAGSSGRFAVCRAFCETADSGGKCPADVLLENLARGDALAADLVVELWRSTDAPSVLRFFDARRDAILAAVAAAKATDGAGGATNGVHLNAPCAAVKSQLDALAEAVSERGVVALAKRAMNAASSVERDVGDVLPKGAPSEAHRHGRGRKASDAVERDTFALRRLGHLFSGASAVRCVVLRSNVLSPRYGIFRVFDEVSRRLSKLRGAVPPQLLDVAVQRSDDEHVSKKLRNVRGRCEALFDDGAAADTQAADRPLDSPEALQALRRGLACAVAAVELVTAFTQRAADDWRDAQPALASLLRLFAELSVALPLDAPPRGDATKYFDAGADAAAGSTNAIVAHRAALKRRRGEYSPFTHDTPTTALLRRLRSALVRALRGFASPSNGGAVASLRVAAVVSALEAHADLDVAKHRLGCARALVSLLPPAPPAVALACAADIVDSDEYIAAALPKAVEPRDDGDEAPAPGALGALRRAAGGAALTAALDGRAAASARAAAAAAELLAAERDAWDGAVSEAATLAQHVVACVESGAPQVQRAGAAALVRCAAVGPCAAQLYARTLVKNLRAAIAVARKPGDAHAVNDDAEKRAVAFTKVPGSISADRVGRLLVGVRELCHSEPGRAALFAVGAPFALVDSLSIAKAEILRLALDCLAALVASAGASLAPLLRGRGASSEAGDAEASEALVNQLCRAAAKVLAKYHRADLQLHCSCARILTLLARVSWSAPRVRACCDAALLKRVYAGLSAALEEAAGKGDALMKLAASDESKKTATSEARLNTMLDDVAKRAAKLLRCAAWLAHAPAALAWDSGLDAPRLDAAGMESLLSAAKRFDGTPCAAGLSLRCAPLPAYARLALRAAVELVEVVANKSKEATPAPKKDEDGADFGALILDDVVTQLETLDHALGDGAGRSVKETYDADEAPGGGGRANALGTNCALGGLAADEAAEGRGDAALVRVDDMFLWDSEDAALSFQLTASKDAPLVTVRAALPARDSHRFVVAETKRLAVERRANADCRKRIKPEALRRAEAAPLLRERPANAPPPTDAALHAPIAPFTDSDLPSGFSAPTDPRRKRDAAIADMLAPQMDVTARRPTRPMVMHATENGAARPGARPSRPPPPGPWREAWERGAYDTAQRAAPAPMRDSGFSESGSFSGPPPESGGFSETPAFSPPMQQAPRPADPRQRPVDPRRRRK